MEHIKPPLGVCPKNIWELQRAQELARAVEEYLHYENFDRNLNSMTEWVNELSELLSKFKNDQNFKYIQKDNVLKIYKGHVYHCPTKELAEKFLEQLNIHGYTWNYGKCVQSLLENVRWEECGVDTCYYIHDDYITHSDLAYYTQNNYNIVEYKGEKLEF
jgi:hypothetical protein